jgi:hypothetical protein
MNRRNFFGTIGAAIAGAVLGGTVKPAQPAWGFAAGDDLLLKPGSITFDALHGLRLWNHDDLYVRTFIADEVRVGGGARIWQVGIDADNSDRYKVRGCVGHWAPRGFPTGDVNDVDWYGAWL